MSCTSSPSGSRPAGIHFGLPPVDARQPGAPSYLHTGAFQAQVALDCEGKRVLLGWERSSELDFEAPELAVEQAVSVSFWPTSAELVDDATLLVAGKDRDGDTRIERWSLAPPLVSALATGKQVLLPRPPEDLTVVYEAAVEGRDMVRAMLKLEGKPGFVLAQFHDSRDLVEVGYQDEPYPVALALSATAQPALGLEYTDCWGGVHDLLGHVYVFSAPQSYGDLGPLVVVDQDGDGTLDSSTEMSWQDYEALGMTDFASFRSLRGESMP